MASLPTTVVGPLPSPDPQIPKNHSRPGENTFLLTPQIHLPPYLPCPCDPKTSAQKGAEGSSGGGSSSHRRYRSRPEFGPGTRRPHPATGDAMRRQPRAPVPARTSSVVASCRADRQSVKFRGPGNRGEPPGSLGRTDVEKGEETPRAMQGRDSERGERE